MTTIEIVAAVLGILAVIEYARAEKWRRQAGRWARNAEMWRKAYHRDTTEASALHAGRTAGATVQHHGGAGDGTGRPGQEPAA